MRLIYTLLLLLIGTNAFSQSYIPFGANKVADTSRTYNALFLGAVRMPVYGNNDTNRVITFNQQGQIIFVTKGNGGGTSIDTSYVADMISDSLEQYGVRLLQLEIDTIPLFTVTSLPALGQSYYGKPSKVIMDMYAQTLPPTLAVTLTVNGSTSTSPTIEKRPVGTSLPVTINWTAGRQSNTAPLSTIVANGVTQPFSQPSAPGSVSGTQSATVTANTTGNYTVTVTTTDGKNASLTRNITWYDKRYWGMVASQNPNDADILSLTSDNNGATRTKSTTNVTNSTARKLVWAVPESTDPTNITEIWIGGLNSTAAFTRTVRAFTNASGFTSNYIIFVQNTTTSGNVSFEIK